MFSIGVAGSMYQLVNYGLFFAENTVWSHAIPDLQACLARRIKAFTGVYQLPLKVRTDSATGSIMLVCNGNIRVLDGTVGNPSPVRCASAVRVKALSYRTYARVLVASQ
ncbi:hypothetical protein QFC19_008200 [Naganishia cerealis]|uniref:Uncharacterized protein n=1 Tax=Naganishia cerealis TaxID=610337 RepID=A0ACC2V527_9TREE|nr:hypothetical protein QFC19_008200 [Naganishia cerealis]